MNQVAAITDKLQTHVNIIINFSDYALHKNYSNELLAVKDTGFKFDEKSPMVLIQYMVLVDALS